MYLEAITLTRTIPCLAEPGKIIIYGKPSRTLEDILPYLATLLDVIAYNPEASTLTFRRQTGFLTLYADKVFITKVTNTDEGLQLLDALRDAINATWEHRNELVAVTAIRRAPRPLDVWLLLPQSNCKRCGEETCLAFACNLLLQNRELDECLPLQTEAVFAERLATLRAIFSLTPL